MRDSSQCKRCSSFDPNCQECSDYQQCTKCQGDRYYIDGGVCKLCADAMDGCESC